MDKQQEAISLDVLAESLNLGLGHVIDELAEISDSRIELHVPEVNLMPKTEALARASAIKHTGDKAIFVKQTFSGDLEGEAVLFFSEEESLKLLNGILSEDEDNLIEFADSEEEMLLDITNVAVTGVIYALSSLLGMSLQAELPQCELGSFQDLKYESDLFDEADDLILFLSIGFTVVKKDSKATLMFFQKKDALTKLYSFVEKRMGLSL